MSEWVLILWFWAFAGSFGTVSGFTSQAKCEAAAAGVLRAHAEKYKENAPKYTTPLTACVER